MADQKDSAKVAVHARIGSATLALLDKLGTEKRPAAKRSQMIELAVVEYVERNKPKGKR